MTVDALLLTILLHQFLTCLLAVASDDIHLLAVM